MSNIIPIPYEKTQDFTCHHCNYISRIYVKEEASPHLYCTACNNVYHEDVDPPNYKTIRTNWGRRKKMNLIESQAPICRCGGLFLFNAHPNCPHCGQDFNWLDLSNEDVRLHHNKLMIFDGTLEYSNNGHEHEYHFSDPLPE